MKIIAMLPVKNESWVLEHCLRSLSFCDEILAIDDNSTDSTRAILEKYNCIILGLDTQTKIGWKEFEIRSFLLSEARKRNATHLVAIDADEMFSDDFVINARATIEKLPLGEPLSLPWVNILSTTKSYSPTVKKQFIIHDDATSLFRKTFMHVPRVPTYHLGTVLEEPNAVIHFQHLNIARNAYKNVWYMMSELLKRDRQPFRINAMYRHNTLKVARHDILTLTKRDLPDPRNDTAIWQRDKISEMFAEKGIKFFEPLDIWYIPELRKKFITDVGREPKPSLAPNWILYLNDIKNKIKNQLYASSFKNN